MIMELIFYSIFPCSFQGVLLQTFALFRELVLMSMLVELVHSVEFSSMKNLHPHKIKFDFVLLVDYSFS